MLDDAFAPQSCLQEEGNHHSSASLLLWTPAEEKCQGEGEYEGNSMSRVKGKLIKIESDTQVTDQVIHGVTIKCQ